MNYFLAGGSKSGKSMLGQRVARALAPTLPHYYLATMIPHDPEDDACILRHRAERAGWGFETIECGVNILSALDRAAPNAVFLLDSITALLSNEMFRADGTMDDAAGARLAAQLVTFAQRTGNTVFVCDQIFSDAICYDVWTDRFRQALGQIGTALCAVCENVCEVAAGIPDWYKGGFPQ